MNDFLENFNNAIHDVAEFTTAIVKCYFTDGAFPFLDFIPSSFIHIQWKMFVIFNGDIK